MYERESVGKCRDQRRNGDPSGFLQHLFGVNREVVAEAGNVAGSPRGEGEEHRDGDQLESRCRPPNAWCFYKAQNTR